ncbi:hypothetical protein [Sphingomonas lenta]|uniref:Uncharacterized protein n=1 Tax=Sphingomonas lenta TaxID=1141887 RepID=A0A2A2SDR2_9SPHN|nr:hypothetical protein [Sphingomonas lenta]PAX07353.1 hypothetical protein CKY28_15175 [Sphingomonas lenta]
MSRLIDLREGPVGNRLELELGDLVLLPGAGAKLTSGSAVELLGVHRSATPLADGRVLAPEGAPDVVTLSAFMPGEATVRLMTGDPFGGAVSRELLVTVRGR